MLTKPKKVLSASELTTSALKEMSYRNMIVWRNNNVRAVPGRTFTGKKGVPDIIGYGKFSGAFIAAEVKAGKDKLSKDQIDFLLELNKHGGIALVVYEKNGQCAFTDILDYLKLNQ